MIQKNCDNNNAKDIKAYETLLLHIAKYVLYLFIRKKSVFANL